MKKINKLTRVVLVFMFLGLVARVDAAPAPEKQSQYGCPIYGAQLDEMLRRRLLGYFALSLNLQLTTALLGRNLLHGNFASDKSEYRSSFDTSSASTYGVQTWVQDWDFNDEDGLTFGAEPYFQSNLSDSVSYTVGIPVFWTTIEDMKSDNFWAAGLDGSIRKDFENGFFAGLHVAGMSAYASSMSDNQFFSFSGGPFVGYEYLITERLTFNCAALTEGNYTEKTATTWYVAGGIGFSALVTDSIIAHLNGTYYRSMDTYQRDEDADFFDVGLSMDIQMNECSLLNLGISTITGADEVDSVTASIGVSYCF